MVEFSSTSSKKTQQQQQWEGRALRMKQKRRYHGAVLLRDNRILITGGRNGRRVLDTSISSSASALSLYSSSAAVTAIAEIVNITNDSSNSTSAIIPPLISRSDHASVYVNSSSDSSSGSSNSSSDDSTSSNRSNRYNNAYAYVIGGFDGSDKLKSVERINVDVPSPRWETVADMNYARRGCAAATVSVATTTTTTVATVSTFSTSTNQNIIFVFGGYDENGNNVSAVEYLIVDTSTSATATATATAITSSNSTKWNTIPGNEMKIPRYDHTAVSVGNMIYIIGGIDSHGEKITEVEIFDTATKSFVECNSGPPLPIPMTSMSAVVLELGVEDGKYADKYILISGGKTTDNHAIGESYILNTTTASTNRSNSSTGSTGSTGSTAMNQEWQTINVPLQTPRYGHAAVIMNNGIIFVCGGRDDDHSDLDSIETISFLDLLPHETIHNDDLSNNDDNDGDEEEEDESISRNEYDDDDKVADENADDGKDCFGISSLFKYFFISGKENRGEQEALHEGGRDRRGPAGVGFDELKQNMNDYFKMKQLEVAPGMLATPTPSCEALAVPAQGDDNKYNHGVIHVFTKDGTITTDMKFGPNREFKSNSKVWDLLRSVRTHIKCNRETEERVFKVDLKNGTQVDFTVDEMKSETIEDVFALASVLPDEKLLNIHSTKRNKVIMQEDDDDHDGYLTEH